MQHAALAGQAGARQVRLSGGRWPPQQTAEEAKGRPGAEGPGAGESSARPRGRNGVGMAGNFQNATLR